MEAWGVKKGLPDQMISGQSGGRMGRYQRAASAATTYLLLLLRKGSKASATATETGSEGLLLQNLPPTQTSGVIG